MASDSDSSEDLPDPTSKLIKGGPALTNRFLTKPILYSQQKQALTKLIDWFANEETKDKTAVVAMPTGSGKTGIIACLPYCLGGAVGEGRITDIDLNKPILVIAPGLIILSQLEENLDRKPFLRRVGLIKKKERRYGYLVRKIMTTEDVSILNENARQYEIVLTNAQKWRRKHKTDPTPNYEDLPANLFSMIIVDEAHHLPAKQWQEIITKFKPRAKVVFFTATPYRTDKKEITTDLALSKVGFAYKLSREDAIKDRLIRELEVTILSSAEIPPPTKKPKHEQDISEKNVCILKVLEKIKERIKEKNRDSPLPDGKKHASIIIAHDIEEAKEVDEMCKDVGFQSVALLHCKNTQTKNEKTTSEIRDGKYEVVIVVKMLLEGFDYPPFSIAGIVTKIVSPVKFAQFIGRIQRVVGRDKREKADVITHKYFQQESMLQKYLKPVISEKEEDKSLDIEEIIIYVINQLVASLSNSPCTT